MKRGLELHQAGRGEEAATFYSKAMRIERDHPDANHLFGLVELHRGRPAAAVRHIAIARASRPNDPQILANMGVALSAADRHEDAVEVLQQAVSINPQFAEAHANLGRAYRLMGRFDDAVAAYSRAIEVKPTEASFHYHLGNSLRLAGYIFEAESAYRIAFERRPNHGPAYGQLAFMLVNRGQAKQALGLLERAQAILPADAELYLHRSRALHAERRLDEAVETVDRAIELNPNYAEAHLYRARIVRHEVGDGAVSALDELFRSRDASVDARIFAGFGLGKALADIGDHDGSIAAFKEANRLRRQMVPFSLPRVVGRMRTSVERFGPAPERHRAPTAQADGPIFVVGLPRAGKSTVERILSSHPAVAAAGELPTMGRLVRHLFREANGGSTPDLSPERVAKMGAAYMREAERLVPPGRRIIDTMPSNYHRIGYILEAMPNARIIHCVRPRGEHCVAIFEKLLTESGFEYSNDLGDLLGYHAAYRRMTSDWHERFPGAIHDVDITGLLSGGTMDIESLLRFCGIQSDGAVVSDAQSEPQHLEWSAQRIASNRTAHLAAWRAAQPELWE